MEGMITKLNTIKNKTVLLNVNSRIVQNQEITKIVERAYSQCYQSIHQENEGYFVYLSVEIDARKIDCNQHPSKKVIGFFSADKIYQSIYKWLVQNIKEESSIKSIATNVVTKGNNPFNASKNAVLQFKSQVLGGQENKGENVEEKHQKPDKMPKEQPVYAFQKNRTDSLQMPLNFYMKQK